MKKAFIFSCMSIVTFLFLSCNQSSEEFERAFSAALGKDSGFEMLDAFLKLDQEYPKKLKLKVNIGATYLLLENYERAAIYLEEGLKYDTWTAERRTRYLLYANLAELRYRQKEYKQALTFCDIALKLDKRDPIGTSYIKAKSLTAQENYEQALSAFEDAMNLNAEEMRKEDQEVYIRVLVQTEEYAKALRLIQDYKKRFGYVRGLGLHESRIYEKLNRRIDSIFAAFKELEYQRFYGAIGERVVLENLNKLEEAVSGAEFTDIEELKIVIEGLQLYVTGHYEDAYGLLKTVEPGIPFSEYLINALKLESEEAGQDLYKVYSSLEEQFSDLPGYYYHAWRSMSRIPQRNKFSFLRPLLERTIELAPSTPYATESRIKLGSLLGFDKELGELIILIEEADELYEQAMSSGDPKYLLPLIRIQKTPENIYQMHAYLKLTQAARSETYRDVLRDTARQLEPPASQRLNAISASF